MQNRSYLHHSMSIGRSIAVCFIGLLAMNIAPAQGSGQSGGSSSTSTDGYQVTSSVELGVRGTHVNGNDNKFRSDLNYRPGFRVFDSSFLIENNSEDGSFFDSALVTSTGWGGDPSGAFRFNIEKTGIYRLESNVRRVKYFNSLNNHALNQHNADTKHNFGDIDLTVFPERENFRLRFGYSFNRTHGPAGFTTRAYSDEFGILSNVDTASDDFRAGVEGKLAGFNLGFNVGHRRYDEQTRYFIDGLNLGNNPGNNARLFTFERLYPIEGSTNFEQVRAQRTFAKKLDLTARFIYSRTSNVFTLSETITGRDNSNNTVDLDDFDITGNSRRTQSRGDIGVTYRVTDALRISDTVTYDEFDISGGDTFREELRRRNAAGSVLPTVFTNTLADRVTGYRRVTNLIEADYQLNRMFGFNVGYRFTQRRVELEGTDRNLATPAPVTFTEEFENQTHTFIAGLRAKPVKRWVIYADVEHGKADNVFTRLSNYDFTNFRIRNRIDLKDVSINASFISRSNDNPSRSVEVPPVDFTAQTRSRTFTASIDWNPVAAYSFSGGYTFQHVDAETDIIVPVAGVRLAGISQYFVRDSYFFFDVHANPIKRIALFASYRISDDRGQGDTVSLLPQNIITSYPLRFQSPEVRLAIKLTRNIDWNLGYQYFDYRERMVNPQNYNAHLPYTSLRFYFGKAAIDR